MAIEVHRQMIESAPESIVLRIPRELQGVTVEVTISAANEEVAPVASRGIHPGWTPEMLEALHKAAGSMPGLEKVYESPQNEAGERDWHLLD